MTAAAAPFPPDSFWTILPQCDENAPIKYCTTLFTPKRDTKTCTLREFMTLLRATPAPVMYEVLENTWDKDVNAYFDLDKACVGIPEPAECDRIMRLALGFLRNILGVSAHIVVSSAHRAGKMSFHFNCCNVRTTMQVINRITRLTRGTEFELDCAVQKASRQLMRPVMAMGEKSDSVPLIPVRGCEGHFSDHIIQAQRLRQFQVLNIGQVPIPDEPKYVCSDGASFVEELLAKVECNSRVSHEVNAMVNRRLKAEGLLRLFTFRASLLSKGRLGGSGRGEEGDRIMEMWNATSMPETRDSLSSIIVRSNFGNRMELIGFVNSRPRINFSMADGIIRNVGTDDRYQHDVFRADTAATVEPSFVQASPSSFSESESVRPETPRPCPVPGPKKAPAPQVVSMTAPIGVVASRTTQSEWSPVWTAPLAVPQPKKKVAVAPPPGASASAAPGVAGVVNCQPSVVDGVAVTLPTANFIYFQNQLAVNKAGIERIMTMLTHGIAGASPQGTATIMMSIADRTLLQATVKAGITALELVRTRLE